MRAVQRCLAVFTKLAGFYVCAHACVSDDVGDALHLATLPHPEQLPRKEEVDENGDTPAEVGRPGRGA